MEKRYWSVLDMPCYREKDRLEKLLVSLLGVCIDILVLEIDWKRLQVHSQTAIVS
ncbi:hypothetical protein SK128_019365 [Halocaridina rubra]|uniref:Uncharacterized protein n=1 Tax=Halocaridina rubra TaxID=373956 RepID=A0AAN8ZWT5_HALRR